jgi:two-component system cell cycle sensor histidine kinase/response regulator CckA
MRPLAVSVLRARYRPAMTAESFQSMQEAAAAARRAAALLENLGHQVPGVIYQFQLFPDGRSRFPYASEAMKEIYELSPEEVSEDATAVFHRLHPDDYDRVAASIEQSSATLDPWQCDYRVILPRQGVRWRSGTARPERLPDGSTLWHGFITDSTEQQLARVALRESEERFRIQVEHAPEAIVVYDVEAGCFTDVNHNAERLFGFSRSELLTRSVADVTPPSQPDGRPSDVAAAAFISAAVRGELPVFEWTHQHRSGRPVVCEVRLARLPFDGRVLVRGSISDITERKESQDALTRIQAAVETSLNGVAMADLDGRLIYVNRAALALWGYGDVAESLGRDVRSFWQWAGEADDVVSELLQRGTWSGEMRARRTDGALRTLQVSASIFPDSRGLPAGMLASFVDITEEEQLQAQLLQAQKLESVGRLAGGIAHDFNNLLTVMKGYLELAMAAGPLPDAVREDLLAVSHAADSAAGLTQQLLAFSRKQIIAPVVLDLNDVVRRVQGMLQRLIGEDIALQISTATSLGHVRFDPGQAEQILVNLAINARDAMPDGGTLTLETSNVILDDGYERTHPGSRGGRYVLLAVSDTGVGMTPETREHAFEPFFTTKEVGRGTGLGLAMIHGAVSQNGGRVEVYSELGHGTSFKIYLPQVSGEAPALEAIRTQEPPRGHETVMLVEDDDTVRALAARLLARQGYRVLDFADGPSALNWLSTSAEPIALLLTDVIMPAMNGKTLADAVVAARPGTRVLYASGYTSNVIVQHGVLKPGVEFLAKPFTIAALAERVREVLDRARG